ncbi:hypothetical protein SOVF_119680 [Spinacia oleracea]|nr:hypothetical protein SOVF_119680 [Spinacia oleracea]
MAEAKDGACQTTGNGKKRNSCLLSNMNITFLQTGLVIFLIAD